MPVGRLGPTCTVHACMAPVRELGGFCTKHWQGLSAAQRAGLKWDDEHAQPTEPIDALEVVAAIPAFDGVRKWAA